jgi:uracil-DNA glycosylase
MINLEQQLGPEWYPLLRPEFEKPATIALGKLLTAADQTGLLTPKPADIFRAFEYCPPSRLKVLIIGQDPYPGEGVAHGLSFSYRGKSTPASLRIIFKELERSGFGKRTNADLTDWAEQDVMLLNAVLTTTTGVSLAHKNCGWEIITGRTLQIINDLPQKLVVMAWGSSAKDLVMKYIRETDKHLILKCCHPMAEQYSGGQIKFTGNDHFRKTNEFLGQDIRWV